MNRKANQMIIFGIVYSVISIMMLFAHSKIGALIYIALTLACVLFACFADMQHQAASAAHRSIRRKQSRNRFA